MGRWLDGRGRDGRIGAAPCSSFNLLLAVQLELLGARLDMRDQGDVRRLSARSKKNGRTSKMFAQVPDKTAVERREADREPMGCFVMV